jgi:hypothetical protein
LSACPSTVKAVVYVVVSGLRSESLSKMGLRSAVESKTKMVAATMSMRAMAASVLEPIFSSIKRVHLSHISVQVWGNFEKAYGGVQCSITGVFATKKFATALIFVLAVSAAACLAGPAAANPESDEFPVLAMPKEYVNYTITEVNGTLWAKIDGTYPIQVLTVNGGSCVPSVLPMVYPTPPGTTDFHAWVDGAELECSDWPYGTHHTAIGDWDMVYCEISPVSQRFLLTVQYEHPVAVVNGSSLFLYDLNIADYLTALSPSSRAYFTVRFEAAVSDVSAYTALTDSVWNEKDFTSSVSCDAQTVSIEMRSVLGEPLAGDLVVVFQGSGQVPEEFPFLPVVAVAVAVAVSLVLVYVVTYRRKR